MEGRIPCISLQLSYLQSAQGIQFIYAHLNALFNPQYGGFILHIPVTSKIKNVKLLLFTPVYIVIVEVSSKGGSLFIIIAASLLFIYFE